MAETIELGIVGIKNCGEYDSETNYEKLNVVTYQGSSYCALKDTVGNLPTDAEYWQLYAAKGDTGATGPTGSTGPTGPTGPKGDPSGAPLAVSSISEMTDTTKVYVNTTDGYWYYYDGTNWVQGGIYQGTTLNDNTVSGNKIYLGELEKFDGIDNYYRNTNGELSYNTSYKTSNFIPINNDDVVTYSNAIGDYILFFDSNKNYISRLSSGSVISSQVVTVNVTNVAYIVFNLNKNYNHTIKINGKDCINIYSIPWLLIKDNNIENNSIKGDKIVNNTIEPEKIDKTNGYSLVNNSLYTISAAATNYIKSINGFSRFSELIEVNENDVINVINARATYLTTFDADRVGVLDYNAGATASNRTITIPNGVKYIGINIDNNYLNSFKIYINNNEIKFDNGNRYELEWLTFTEEQIKSIINISNSRFSNYKVLFIGDSITENNYRANTNWVNNITNWLNIDNYLNGGMSGTGILQTFSNFPNWLTKLDDYDNDYDLILIMGDMNDFISGEIFNPSNLGNYGDSTTSTFYGTLKVYLEAILNKYPLAKIGWITSTPRNKRIPNTDDLLHSKTSIFNTANNIIKEMCNNYSIPVLDLYNESNLYPWLSDNREEYFKPDTGDYSADGTHPNSKGQLIMSYKIYDFIIRNF